MSEITTDPAAIPALPLIPETAPVAAAEPAWVAEPTLAPVAPEEPALPPVEPAAPVEVPAVVTAPPGGSVITLASGFKVAVRDAKAIRNRERRELFKGVAEIDDNADKAEVGLMMSQRIAAILITAWDVRSVDDALVPFGPVLPIPALDMEGLDDMPIGDVAGIETVVGEAQKILMPDFSPNPSESSPTPPSAG